MSNFLLNLANRSAGGPGARQGRGQSNPGGEAAAAGPATLPQARPHLMPIFMPPAPALSVPPAYAPPAFAPQINAPVQQARGREARFEGEAPALPVEANSDFARSLRSVTPTPLGEPPVTANLPQGEMHIERAVTARPMPLRVQPAMPESLPIAQRQSDTAIPASDRVIPLSDSSFRSPQIVVEPAAPHQERSITVAHATANDESRRWRATAMPAPLPNAQTPSNIVPSAPRPQEIETPRAPTVMPPSVMPRLEPLQSMPMPQPQQTSPLALERVAPAAANLRQPPAIRQEPATPAIEVQIGTIDLHFAPPAPAPAAHLPQRHAYGFDSFRRLRSADGWEA